MSNPFNPRKTNGAKRGGVKNRPDWDRSVRIAAQRIMDTGSTSKIVAQGKAGYTPAMSAHFEGEETPEDFIIARRSISRAQHLAVLPQVMEFEAMSPAKCMHLVTKGPHKGKIVETTEPNNRLIWKSDKNLLNRSKVDQFGQINRKTGKLEDRMKRMSSGSKKIRHTTEDVVTDDYSFITLDNPDDPKPL